MTAKFLTVKDLAERYGVSRITINHWRNRGLFPQGMKVARTRRWSLSEITAWEKSAKEVNA